jgi:gephyrin
VTLAHDFRLNHQRAEYHCVTAIIGRDGLIYASSAGSQRSSRVGSLKSANALLCLPSREGALRKGEQVEALPMGKLGSEIGGL